VSDPSEGVPKKIWMNRLDNIKCLLYKTDKIKRYIVCFGGGEKSNEKASRQKKRCFEINRFEVFDKH